MDKKKIRLLIIISVIVMLLLAIGLVALLYFTTDLFKTNQQTFWKYISNNSQLVNLLTNENTQTQEQWKKSNSYTSKGNLTISVQKGEEAQEVHLTTSSKYDKTTNRNYSDIILKNGEEDLFKASYAHSDDIYAIQATDIYEPYLGIRNSNLKEFAKNMGLSEEQIPDTISFEMINNAYSISEEEEKYLLDTYSNIIMNSIPKEKYTKTEKTNIKIQNMQYEAIGYGLTINEEEFRQIIVNVLTKASNDTTTLTILNKLVENEDTNLQETLQKTIEEIQKEELEPATLSLLVYQSKGKTIQTQIKINEEFLLKIDIEKNEPQHQKAIITVVPQLQEEGETQQDVQLLLEKQVTNSATNHNSSIIMNLGEKTREITMNTVLGNVTNNVVQNTSNIVINGNDTVIDVSYDKTMQVATQDLGIPKLEKSNTTIINDYSKQQLEPFFQALGEKTVQVIGMKLNKLNLKMDDEALGLDYMEAILSSFAVVTNANGVEPIIGTIGVAGIEAVRQAVESSTSSIYGKSEELSEATKIEEIKNTVNIIQLQVQSESMTTQSNTQFFEKNNLLTLVQEKFSKCTVTAGNDFGFDNTTKKLKGTVLLKEQAGNSYIVNFTDNTVQKQNDNDTENI